MLLQHLSLSHFRNFARLDAQLPNKSLILLGRNAQGKTSLLESIYFLATLSSFHADTDRQLVNFIEGSPLGTWFHQVAHRASGRIAHPDHHFHPPIPAGQ
jgi:recombinational DNA repair ATPase RecF